nr:putative reverse transcriptase domain-containing protein [Tanacetum cinerariifolium]
KINAECYRARYREEGNGMQHFEDLDKRKFGRKIIPWSRKLHREKNLDCRSSHVLKFKNIGRMDIISFWHKLSATREDDKPEGKQVKDVPIVQDFPKVLSEKLPGLPPARPVKFQIDQIPGVAPVVRAPYHLTPSEMKKLSEQLQEHSNKGFYKTQFLT